MPIPSGFKALVATYRKGYQRFSASPTIAKLNAYISGQIASTPANDEYEAVSTDAHDFIVPPVTSLTPEQKLAIAKIFIEEQPVLPNSQSYKTWQKILRQHYLTAPANTGNPQADEVTDQPRVERLHRDLQHLSQKGLLDINHIDVINHPEDPLKQINDLKTNVNVALKNVLQAYDNGWGNRWWVKTEKTRSPTMQRIADILARAPDFNQELKGEEAKALNVQKLNIIVSGFTPQVMTEDSASYRAWSQMTQLLLYPDNTKDLQEVIDAKIKDIYHYLKNNNTVVADASNTGKLGLNVDAYNKLRNYLRGSTVLLSNDKAPQPSTAWCCHFSFFSWKKTYPTAVPVVTEVSAEQLAYVATNYQAGLNQKQLALLLSKQLPESDSSELVQQHYYFITRCIEHNRFRDILRFSTDAKFILDILKEYFSDPAYQNSNQGIAQNNINAKLCLLLTPSVITAEPRLDERLRGGLFALCARRVDPDSIAVLNSLLPTPLAANPPPNKGALIKAALDYSNAHADADAFLTTAECDDLKKIDLKTIRSPTSSSPVTANTTAGDPHQEAKTFLRNIYVAPNQAMFSRNSGPAYKKTCRETLIAAISAKEGEISGFNEKILAYLESIPPKGATGITIIDALRLDFNGKSYSSGNTLQSVITALRTDIKDTQSAIAKRDSSKTNIV